MGRPGGYLGYMFDEEHSTPDHDGREVRGTVLWTLAPDRISAQGWDQIVKEWSAEGYKIGLLLRTGQEILEFVYGDVPLSPVQPQDQEAQDLGRTYGVPAGYRWVAWGGSGQRQHLIVEPITITFPVRMRLRPAGPDPQLIPVASRHLKGSFTRSMPSVWTIGRGK